MNIGAASKQLPFLVDELRNDMWLVRNIKGSWQRQLNKTTLFPPVTFILPFLTRKINTFFDARVERVHLHFSLPTVMKGTLPSHSLYHSPAFAHSPCHLLALVHSHSFDCPRLHSFFLSFLHFFTTVTTLIPLNFKLPLFARFS